MRDMTRRGRQKRCEPKSRKHNGGRSSDRIREREQKDTDGDANREREIKRE